MIKPFLKTTTALVMMASLTLPAVAQGLDGMTPDDIFDGARDGSLDVGFETDGLSRDQVAAELARLQALCEAGETSEGVNCARISELPDAASLMAGSGQDGAAEEAQATGSQEQDSQELSAQGNATADVAVPEDSEAPADEAETPEAEGEEAPAEAGAQDAPVEAPSTEAQADEAESAPAEASEPAEDSAESEDTDELRDALEEAEAQDAPAAAPGSEAQASETDSDVQQRDAAEDAQAQQGADDAPAAEAEAADTDAPAAETEGADELRDALEEAEAQEAPEDAAPEADAENPEQADAQQEAQTANAEEPSLQAEPEEVSDQEQADAAARLSQQLGAAAAALGLEEAGEPEVVEEEVSDADVRSSDEDFSTQIGESRAQDTDAADERDGDRAEDDDDDNRDEMIRRLGTAAVAGLGAVALSKFLSNDAKVVENTGDRIVVEENGQYRVLRNDDVLLRRPGSDVTTYRYDDGSTRTVVEYQDGNAVETVKAADGRVLRRIRTLPDGEQIVLFDDTQAEQQVVVSDLPQTQDTARRMNIREVGEAELAAALAAESGADVGRTFSLNQIRNIDTVRHLVPEISVDSINFETGSAAIRPQEAQALAALGNAMKRVIADNPREVFLIEGHTDATGGWGYNLALSDRRAESVALALTEYFDVPPENMVLQGYGESDLAVETQTSERANRRAAVRRITPLLQGS
jgi:outer membrane protein OmpA-like peptidoglycan-associated protein